MNLSPTFILMLLGLVGISVFFYLRSADLPLRKRLFASSHGLLVLAAFLFGLFVDIRLALHGIPLAGAGSAILFLLALASIGYCIKVYPRGKVDHLLHLITLWVGAWACFVVLLGLAVAAGELH